MSRFVEFAAAAAVVLVGGNAASAASYLYVEDNNSLISAFEIAKNGSLKEISGSPFNSNTNSPSDFAIAVDGNGPYLYTTGGDSDNVAIFSIGTDGSLTSVSDTTAAGQSAGATVLAKSDKRLYLVNTVDGGAIAAFDVEKSGAKLKPIAGSPFPVSCPGFCTSNPSEVLISGSYLYSIDSYGWYVSSFSVAKNGALTELDSYATDYGPLDGIITPKGNYIYVTDAAHGDISGYSAAAGVLTQLSGSPFPAGNQPNGIVMTPNDKFVYVANYGDGTISGYSIGSGGVLEALAGSPFADGSGTAPIAVAIDKAGKHLFVTNANTQDIAVYDIAESGSITQIDGSPFPLTDGTGPKGLALYEPK
ncbi:MAG TPA: beta-propeller fold lactonase family protein [Rhizomicrobium sp.]|nr:beta-propeller fold lactonase family protein [Rhizomicrobium sp.]